MAALIYFLLLAGLIAVVMRSGCGAHVFGHRHGTAASGDRGRLVPPGKGIDPVCGMTVETAKAKTSIHAGQTYYFCSTTCRDRFEASPASYLKTPPATPSTKEHPHA
jgi:YHS domain-containing protein